MPKSLKPGRRAFVSARRSARDRLRQLGIDSPLTLAQLHAAAEGLYGLPIDLMPMSEFINGSVTELCGVFARPAGRDRAILAVRDSSDREHTLHHRFHEYAHLLLADTDQLDIPSALDNMQLDLPRRAWSDLYFRADLGSLEEIRAEAMADLLGMMVVDTEPKSTTVQGFAQVLF